jgi:hypothetical protein
VSFNKKIVYFSSTPQLKNSLFLISSLQDSKLYDFVISISKTSKVAKKTAS